MKMAAIAKIGRRFLDQFFINGFGTVELFDSAEEVPLNQKPFADVIIGDGQTVSSALGRESGDASLGYSLRLSVALKPANGVAGIQPRVADPDVEIRQ